VRIALAILAGILVVLPLLFLLYPVCYVLRFRLSSRGGWVSLTIGSWLWRVVLSWDGPVQVELAALGWVWRRRQFQLGELMYSARTGRPTGRGTPRPSLAPGDYLTLASLAARLSLRLWSVIRPQTLWVGFTAASGDAALDGISAGAAYAFMPLLATRFCVRPLFDGTGSSLRGRACGCFRPGEVLIRVIMVLRDYGLGRVYRLIRGKRPPGRARPGEARARAGV